MVVGDAVRLHQVLTNLLNNSAEVHACRRDRIWLGLEEDTGAASHCGSGDDGLAASLPEKLGAIFDLFMQVDLGRPIAQRWFGHRAHARQAPG